MTARDFCYWLQGYFEIQAAVSEPNARLVAEQTDCIRRHLSLVFANDIDPQAGGPAAQKKLNALHDPKQDAEKWIARC